MNPLLAGAASVSVSVGASLAFFNTDLHGTNSGNPTVVQLGENTTLSLVRKMPPDVHVRADDAWVVTAKQELELIAGNEPTTALTLARMVLAVLAGIDLKPHRIVPSSDDGISFYFFRSDGFALVECLESKEIVAMTKDSRRDVWDVELNEDEVRLAAYRIQRFIMPQISYDYTSESSVPA